MKLQALLLLSAVILSGPAAGAPVENPAQTSTRPAPLGGWEGELRGEGWPTFATLTLRPEAEGLSGTLEIFGQTIPLDEVRWDGTRLEARIGEGDRAIRIAAEHRGAELSGELRQGESMRPFLFRAVPAYPAPSNRIEAWEQDIDVLATRFVSVDRSFTPGERALFLEALAKTREALPRLSDPEIIMRLASAIALADNAHTRLYILRNRTELRRLPIRLWWFSDGLRVIRATPEYRHLLGCRIDDFDGTDARLARDMVGTAFAGPPSWRDYKSVYSLTSPEALFGAGVTRNADGLNVGVGDCAGPPRRPIVPLPLARSRNSVEAWWDLSPLRENPQGVSEHVLGNGAESLPLYLRNPNANYWFEHLADSGVLYFQFTRAQNATDESVEAFGERLLAELGRRRPRALVLDLRFNTGGNLELASPLMRRLQQASAEIPRYVIIGRATFSAGISHVAQWREAGNVVLVGEPVGDVLEFWAEGGNIRLPNSNLDAHFSNGAHSYSPAPCPPDIPCFDLSAENVRPDLPAASSWADYRAGRDRAMEAVLADLAERQR